jgi:O-acetyl-ADP-ribose deacetylase (regulator of RNase III)
LAECRLLGGCATGEAKITKGYQLAARHVIHTVGPVWRGGDQGEAELLSSCYRSSLRLAHNHGLVSIAFPAISTGIYGYPKAEAAEIAVTTVNNMRVELPILEQVIFCCFDEETHSLYTRLMA